ncbi:MAG: TlpA disulfide reductase family protein [Polyangiaceae bacterium]
MKSIFRASAALLGLAGLAACSDNQRPIDRTDEGRGDRVTSPTPDTSIKPPGSAPTLSKTVGTAPNPKHAKLCGKAIERDLPTVKLDHLEVKGAKALSTELETGGKWTWINVWAAYCGPCREEIPRIKAFGERLEKDGAPVRIHFVSFDDDARESIKFMEKGALSQSLIVDEKDHEKFFTELGVPQNTALPLQVLVDPRSKIRCVGMGAIDDEDYPEIFGIVSKG